MNGYENEKVVKQNSFSYELVTGEASQNIALTDNPTVALVMDELVLIGMAYGANSINYFRTTPWYLDYINYLILVLWGYDGFSTGIGFQSDELAIEGNYNVALILEKGTDAGWFKTESQGAYFITILELSTIWTLLNYFPKIEVKLLFTIISLIKMRAGSGWNELENEFSMSKISSHLGILLGGGRKTPEKVNLVKFHEAQISTSENEPSMDPSIDRSWWSSNFWTWVLHQKEV